MVRIGRRKVQKMDGCLWISIPKTWAEDLGVNKGTSLDVFVAQNRDLIYQVKKAPQKASDEMLHEKEEVE